MLTDLKNHGVADVLIACCDGLKGLPAAITATWPQATVQTCVVHLVRNSLRYASKAHWSKITADLKNVYRATTLANAETAFAEFAETWRGKYPAMVRMWENAWGEFVPFLDFPWEYVHSSLPQPQGGREVPPPPTSSSPSTLGSGPRSVGAGTSPPNNPP